MANKQFNTRIQLKYDTLANWTTNATNFVPMRGEVCIVEIPTGGTTPYGDATPPQYLMKVGDGTTTFPNLAYTSALAADVYAWAKKSVWDYDDAFSATSTDGQKYTNYTKLKSAIESLSTNLEYQLVPGAANSKTLLLQSRTEGSSDTWTTVSTINLTGDYNASTNPLATQGYVDTEVSDAVNALDATVDASITSGSAGHITPTTPTADFTVLYKVNEVDGKVTSTNSGAYNIKKVAATGAAADVSFDATSTSVITDTDVQGALEELDTAVAAIQTSSVTDIDGMTGSIGLGNGLEKDTANNAIAVKVDSNETHIDFDSTSNGLKLTNVDSNYTSANTTNLATVATVTTAIGTLDATQDIVDQGSYTPSTGEKATYKYEFYNVNETDGKVTSTGATVQDTMYFSEQPTASNPVITLNDIADIAGAMVYKGTVNSNSDLPTASTTGVQPGWTYVVATAGTYAGVACEVGDMIIVKTFTSGSEITFNVVNGENQVDNKNANITAGAASGSETTIATVDGTDIKARVSVTAGTATIASAADANGDRTIYTTVEQGNTSSTDGTIKTGSSSFTLKKAATTGAAEDVSFDTTSTTIITDTDVQGALEELDAAVAAIDLSDDLSTATVTANKSVKFTSENSDTDITLQGTDYTNLSLVNDSDTSKTDVLFTQSSNTITTQVNALDVTKLYQKTSDVLVLYGGSSSVLV